MASFRTKVLERYSLASSSDWDDFLKKVVDPAYLAKYKKLKNSSGTRIYDRPGTPNPEVGFWLKDEPVDRGGYIKVVWPTGLVQTVKKSDLEKFRINHWRLKKQKY